VVGKWEVLQSAVSVNVDELLLIYIVSYYSRGCFCTRRTPLTCYYFR